MTDTFRLRGNPEIHRFLRSISDVSNKDDDTTFIFVTSLWDDNNSVKFARKRKARNNLVIVDTFYTPDIASLVNNYFNTNINVVTTPSLIKIVRKDGICKLTLHDYTYDVYRELGA